MPILPDATTASALKAMNGEPISAVSMAAVWRFCVTSAAAVPAAAIKHVYSRIVHTRTFARAPRAGASISAKRAISALRPARCANTAASALSAARRQRPAPAETTYVRVTRNGPTTIAHRTEPASRNALTAHIHIRREAPMCRRTPTGIIRPVPFAVWR